MKFKVTARELIDGEERVTSEYEIEPNRLKETREKLQILVYAGIISSFDIKPMQEVQNDER